MPSGSHFASSTGCQNSSVSIATILEKFLLGNTTVSNTKKHGETRGKGYILGPFVGYRLSTVEVVCQKKNTFCIKQRFSTRRVAEKEGSVIGREGRIPLSRGTPPITNPRDRASLPLNDMLWLMAHGIRNTRGGRGSLHKLLRRIEMSSTTKVDNRTVRASTQQKCFANTPAKSKPWNGWHRTFEHVSRWISARFDYLPSSMPLVEVRIISVSPRVLPDNGVAVPSLILLGGPGADLDPYLQSPAADRWVHTEIRQCCELEVTLQLSTPSARRFDGRVDKC